MTTIAELGFAVNSESAVKAADDLDRLVDSGKGAEDSAKRVESAWQKAVSGISSDTGQIVKELQQLNSRQDATAQLMAKIALTVEKASASFSSASASADKLSTSSAKVGETADQAKARVLALAVATVEGARAQEGFVKTLDATAGSAAAAARAQLDQLAAQRLAARNAAESSAAQDKSTASTKKAAAASEADAIALGKLVDKIDPAVAALKKLDAQQDLLSKSHSLGLLSDSELSKYTMSIDRSRESLGKFQDGLNKTGISAKQNAAALRLVPAQFTDIFTSIAAGQPITMVALQQGGQLKDSFGGIGAAARALGGYVLGLVNPLTVAGAATAAIAYGAYQGSKEFSEYQKALTLTGGSAGLSAGQLNALAESIGNANGTTGIAAETLASLASTGKIAGESFDEIAVAAISMSEATGKAVEETIAEFVKIADDPVAAAKTLNDQYHFLTAAVYEQIVSLKEQGKEQDAVKLLTDAYAATVKNRAGQVVEDLGYVETAWKAVKTMTVGAIDGLKEFGRQKTIQSQIDQLDSQIASMQAIEDLASRQVGLSDEQLKRYKESAGYDAEKVKSWTIQRGFLQERMDSESAIAKAQGNAQDREKASISAIDSIHASYLTGLDKESKKKLDIADLDRKRAAALKGEGVNVAQINKEYDVALKAINERSKAAKVAAPAVDLTSFNAAENALKSLETTFQNSLKVLDAAQKAGLISDQEYALQKGALLEKEKSDVQAAYQGEISALEAVSAKSSTTGAQRVGIDQKIADARSKMVDALKKLDADQEVLSIQTQERLDKERQAIDAYAQALQDSLKRTQDSLDLQLAGFGMGDQARQQLQEILKIRQDYEDKFDKLERDHRLKRISDNEYDAETKLLQDSLDQRITLQQGYYDREAALRADWMNGASRAFANYIEETKDIAGQTEGLFSNALHGIEDLFVDAATTGKFSFHDLADSIIGDLTRIVAKAYLVTPVLAALGIGGSSATGAGSAGSLASVFGGSGGGLMGSLSNISSVVSVAGSKFGQAIMAGWNGSEGLVGGLQGAFSSGADYVNATITSAFTTGSETASAAATSLASGATQAGYANLGLSAEASASLQAGSTAAGYGGSAAATQAAELSGLQTLSATLGYIQGVYTIFQSFESYGLKGAAVTGGAAAAGAYIGSFFGPLGTAAGFAIGAVVGALGADKLFASGEKYPDLSTSATGNYVNGKYNNTGIAQGWQTKAPKYGSAADAQMSSTLQQFSTTLGSLYEVLGNGADVVAYNTLQQRKTSGKYSTTFGAQLDDGSVITGKQQFKADDISAALTADYDDIMGTFLAKAIVSSKSLPDYFKAQFTEFANDWDTTADEVIKAIEGVFTRFNGVNDALSLINVQNLKLDDTGLMASDSILNMIGAMSDLDTTTATAKEKVDALNTAVGTYYQAFFSADEQFADLTDSLKGAFAGFGLELPDTRSAYRDMVEDIDVTTTAGQAMFATLVGLAQNADSYYGHLEDTAKSAADAAADAQQAALDAAQKMSEALMQGANDAYSALQRSVAAQQKSVSDAYNASTASLNDMLSAANDSVSDLSGVSNDLSSALKALRGDSDSAVRMLRAQAQATLQSALATAKAGGSLANFSGLTDALDTVGSNNTDLYSSLEEFNRDQVRTANVVAELSLLNGKQLTNAEKTVNALDDQLDQAKKAYDAQMAQFDSELSYAQSQLDALNGVDTSIIGVTAAINAMNAAVVAALQGQAAGAGAANTSGNNATLVSSLYKTVLGRDADAAGASYWGSKLQSGQVSYQDAATQIAKEALALDASKYTGSVSQAQIAASKAAAQKYLDSIKGHATGGLITGAGTGTSDSILSWLSNGEYVMKASAVNTYGTDMLDQMNSMQAPTFASGGPVMSVKSPAVASARKQTDKGGESGDSSEAIRQLNKRLGNLETYMESASRDLRQMNTVGVQVAGDVTIGNVVQTRNAA